MAKKYIFVICLIIKSKVMKTTHTQNAKNQKFDMSLIMRRAWKIYHREKNITFSNALKKSWAIAKNKKHSISFNKLYSEYYNNILQLVKMKTNNNILAEDLTSEILHKVYETLDSFNPNKSKLRTWIYSITNNYIIDFYRKNKHSENISHIDNFVDDEGKETFQIESNINESGIEQAEITEAVKKAMLNLNAKEQKITNLYFIEQRKYKEVSEILQISLGSVKGTINRIRAKLQESLQDEYAML